MNLKEYLFYYNKNAKHVAECTGFNHNYVRQVLCESYPVSKKFSIAIESYTNGIVSRDNVMGPPTHQDIRKSNLPELPRLI